MKHILLLFLATTLSFSAIAKEGMWLPLLIEQYNIGEMQADGFKLTAEDVYSVNQASMKDGVVKFGGGCSGVVVSAEGLVFTNHHCGFKYIQRHSTVEHDYLTDGFWAMSRDEELPNPGLSVTFLKEMRDVTADVLRGVENNMTPDTRDKIIKTNSDTLINRAVKGSHYKADVNAFFEGNQFFLFIYEVYTDVRLVGAPPSSVGGFGGNTDNWMWPRHGGDFSVFRIYADANNSPKDYSDDNVPYRPAYSFPVSLKGVHEDDFTMVFGYPGTTQEYKTSYHLKMLHDQLYPKLIEVRDRKLEVINYHMDFDPARRIKYADKEASLSNSWKRWRGEINGLDRFDVIHKKEEFEKGFQSWADNTAAYKTILDQYKTYYAAYESINTDANVLRELFGRNSMECFSKANAIQTLLIKAEKGNTRASDKELREFYKDYDVAVDRDLTKHLLTYLYKYPNQGIVPATLKSVYNRKKGDIDKITDYLYKQSIIDDTLWIAAYSNGSDKVIRKLEKDPFRIAYSEYSGIYYDQLLPEVRSMKASLDSLDRIYMKALMAYEPDKVFFPDANSTMRVSYGKVKGYDPKDGVHYKYYTTSEGILQKDDPEIYDYNVPDRLRRLLKEGDFGAYGENGQLHIDFVATNHTTGGNSGSPVFNANGELIGLNFDRAWDGVMSDLYYNPEICRNITVDIRYILFIIDKFAAAGYLLDEMKIIR
ncbi:S46 family peptidase [Saccharicrinis sp. FJH54]|uniref:S46 family peptidase n=1 Tax=Saccharicrinis sp. FJH54 TaxID=3344665 RepID=UPI0035D48A2C